MNEENLKPWPKGVSGNPGGRGSPRAEFWRQFRKAITDKDFKAIADVLLREAKKGEGWAVKLFFDKCLGTEVVLSSEGTPTGEPQVLNIAELLKGSGLSDDAIKGLRKKAIAMAFPGRGFGNEEEEA